jgi:hypothetical protein
MKRKNQRLLLIVALAATLAFALTSCRHKAPTVIDQWWNDQQPKP